MTILLEKAIKKVSDLSDIEQDEIAGIILSEIEDENTWYKKFVNSQKNYPYWLMRREEKMKKERQNLWMFKWFQ